MFTNPAQLLVIPLLGLVALSVLVAALLLLRQSFRPSRVVVPAGSDRSSRDVARDFAPVANDAARRRDRRVRPWALMAALLLLAWVFLGRYLLVALAAAGNARPADALVEARVPGSHRTSLAVAERGAAGAPTLVFTHGWGADRRDWTDLLAALPPDLHVVTWDLPGLGASTEGDAVSTSMSAMADQLEDVVQATARGGPVILVGHSIGGMLNLEYAREHSERLGKSVVGLVEVNTTFTNPLLTKSHAERSRRLQPVYEPMLHVVEATAPVCRALGWLAWSSGLAHLELAMQSFAGNETWAQLDDMARYAWRSDPGVVARGVVAMMHWDASDVLPRVNVPTLVLAGAQDRTTLPAASQRIAHDIPAAQLSTIAPAAHLGPVESAPAYAARIIEFTRQVTGAAQVASANPSSR
ncbi:MAG: alpha/beta fold hydrolase [Vitreoscilla sp.]